jgi:membrane-bound serine protease (ClpP class)
MDPMALILLFATAGIVLLVGELLLPTHGVLGIIGLLCIGAAVFVIFRVNQWVGLAVFVGLILASPFIINFAMTLWAKSPVGRRIILQPLAQRAATTTVTVGQTGRAVTELRPIGECDFGEQRLEALSELGIIHAGQQVRIVSIDNGRPTVRAVEA